jgi:HEAT repeat protein
VADVRTQVFSGFGIRTALRGHDMHGLVQGPDGRIYWSIGDRGYRVTTKEGKELARTFTGAVFRCEPNGDNLEVFAHSLRNPQELAFNQWGDLFTGDNNSDAGDRARIVYIMEGGETGWDMNYQTLEGQNQRGPWSQEHTWWKWDAQDRVRPAWTLPPIDHQTDGPSGLAFYPGVGFPERYNNHFFLCDFLGGDEYSRVMSFAVEPSGAGYAVVDAHPFVNAVLATDVDFGYDGRMYISDWSNGWYSDHTGQIFRVWDPAGLASPFVQETQEIFRAGFAQRDSTELLILLTHPDIRVRQRAHLELAGRGSAVQPMLQVFVADGSLAIQPRLHALWALGVQARLARGSTAPDAAETYAGAEPMIVVALADDHVEIRRLAARLAGDARLATAAEPLMSLLSDDDLRVRAQAAIALGKLQHKDAIPNLSAVIWENDNQDPFLRHAAVMGLVGMNAPDKIYELAADQFAQNRLAAVLVMRQSGDPQLARLLHDPDLRVATEAARAVNDLPILEAQSALAALADTYATSHTQAPETAPVNNQWKRELWANCKDVRAEQLDNAEVFATPPTKTETVEEAVGFTKAGNDYVQRLTGFFTAPVDGEYLFVIASDDDGQLLLCEDGLPEHAKPAARVQNYVNPHTWNSQPGQRSAPLALNAGQKVWVDARARQQGGGDHLAIGVVHPDGYTEGPIGSYKGDVTVIPLLRRVINANLRQGTAANASALADLARNSALPPAIRAEAMAALVDFMQPGERDRVNGHWRPVDPAPRDRDAFVQVLKQRVPSLVANGTADVRALARQLASTYSIPMDSGAALATVLDSTKPVAERVACLQQLTQDADSHASQAIDAALASNEPRLRSQARTALAAMDPARGVPLLVTALREGSTADQQASIAALAITNTPQAQAAVAEQVERLANGTLPSALVVDVVEAAEASPTLKPRVDVWRASLPKDQPSAAWMDCAQGGDAERGRYLVNYHSASACLRCHTVEGTGGHAAPPLAGVAARLTRPQLVLSLLEPNAQVAEGFGPVSAMPAMGTMLTPRQVRDIVEYLSTLK